MKQTFVKAAIMASFMAAVSCGQAPTEQGPAQYGVTTIATTDREIQSNYSATIRGRQDIDIYPQVSGTISELRVTEGQSGSKGQTLFIIDQVPYKAALQTAEANVAAAKASVAIPGKRKEARTCFSALSSILLFWKRAASLSYHKSCLFPSRKSWTDGRTKLR